MAYGLIGLYGIYLIFVGYKGNTQALFSNLSNDAPGFLPWLIVVVVLGTMYRSDTLRPIIKPFIALAILTFVLKNFGTLKSELASLVGAIQQGSLSNAVTTTPVSNVTSNSPSLAVLPSLISNPFLGGL